MKRVEAKPEDFQIGLTVWCRPHYDADGVRVVAVSSPAAGSRGMVIGSPNRTNEPKAMWEIHWVNGKGCEYMAPSELLIDSAASLVPVGEPETVTDADHCECRAPWWAFWNPHSRFGWLFFGVLGASVPMVIESVQEMLK